MPELLMKALRTILEGLIARTGAIGGGRPDRHDLQSQKTRVSDS
ncbi:hypothetical protein FHT28_006666 [Rhizobium sp. SG570]|jgi:hypothetical protein|nr:hypothetical protein [Rhizobium sp. SG741]NKJ39905.1 hypothetical protein [Rhizobium sp. SG570]NRP87124.1 hypothetical protein [Ensifer adhaerens]